MLPHLVECGSSQEWQKQGKLQVAKIGKCKIPTFGHLIPWVLQNMPHLVISMGTPNVATFGGVDIWGTPNFATFGGVRSS